MWQWLGRRRRRRGQRLRVLCVDDPPDRAEPGILYLVGEVAEPWAAVLSCPCACGARTELLLLKGEDTYWRVAVENDGRVTLYPSVWRTTGCRSHYLVHASQIIWC